jgi:poly(A) polymerase/tRNA nucleotidyltransferase (CCA-adding enzyme)
MLELTETDRKLAAVLPPGTLFTVGGRVRDEVRAEIDGVPFEAKDADYVVVGVPEAEVAGRLEAIGRVDRVGAAFSVLKVTVAGETVDVALPRRERSSGPGHRDFEVESGPGVTLEEDLGRRDFRINMIARAIPSGTIVDPFGGRDDIAARRIDITREATFPEDPLRLLRACQFAARFRYDLSERASRAMRAAAELVLTVSAERVADELTKLLTLAERPSLGVELMRAHGLLDRLWPELLEGVGVEQNEWHAFEVYRHNLETLDASPPDLIPRLAGLFHDVGKPRVKNGPHFYRHEHVGEAMAREMLDRFRFPREVTEAVAHLVKQHMYCQDPGLSAGAVRRFIRRVGVDHLGGLFALRRADVAGSGLPKRDDSNERFEERVAAVLSEAPPFTVKDLAVKGDDVIEMMVEKALAAPGFRGDERVGEALSHLFEQVTDNAELNERPKLLGMLESYLDRRST